MPQSRKRTIARWTFFLAALGLIVLIIIGCGRAINRSAERRIRDALPDLLGPARQYNVHIDNAPERTLQGRLATVTVDGDDVQLSNGLLLDHLQVVLKDVDVDTGRRQIRKIGEARFTLTLKEASLDEYLAGEAPEGENLRNIRVTFGANSETTVKGERVTLGIGVPFRLSGPLRVAGPQRIELDPNRLTVVGIPLSGTPLQFIKNRIESAVDLTKMPIPLELTGLKTQPGSVTLTGTADIATILKRTQDGHK